jgi:serine/threonine-protein kinase RsbW
MAQRIEVRRTARPSVPEAASVLLTVPAHKDYIVIVRSAVAQLGACFGFSVGEIGDLRLAVDEACNLLIAGPQPALAHSGSSLRCRAEVRGDRLWVRMSASPAIAGRPDTAGFGWIVLTALVDTRAWGQDDDAARVEMEKRRGPRVG